MSDEYKFDPREKIEIFKGYKNSSQMEMTESNTALGYLDMNSEYIRMRKGEVWREDDRESQRKWKDEKKACARRKKELERAWHTNTRDKKRTLESKKGSNNPKEKAYYTNYSLRELEVFIKNSDRGGNSDSYNAVATELELYNHLTGRKDAKEHEGLEALIRLESNCRDYITGHTNPRTTKGKIRKSVISTILDKAEFLVNEQKTKASEEATRTLNVWKEEKTEENLGSAFQANYVKMFHYLKGNIELDAEQKAALDRDFKELLVSVSEQPVYDNQSNTMASRFFNVLGWSNNQAMVVDGEQLQNELTKSPVNRVFHHTINSISSTRDDVFPEDGTDEEKSEWLSQKSAIDLARNLAGLGEVKKRQYYSTGKHGKGTYLDVADCDADFYRYESSDEKAVEDCWDYGMKAGSMQLDMVLNGNARVIKEQKLLRMIDKFATEFPEVYEYLTNSEKIKLCDDSPEYLTMFAALFGFNVINGGPPAGGPYYQYEYFVSSDRSALTISRDYTMRVNERTIRSKNRYYKGKL